MQSRLELIIEAALFCANKPLSLQQIINILPEELEADKTAVQEALSALEAHYAERGIMLKMVGSGYRFQVSAAQAVDLHRLFEEKPARYSRALLETLALVAYRQPITRAEIEQVRGVVVSTAIMKTLLEHDWVRVVGHKDVPGRPALYATTKAFLDHFNLKSLEELPPLSEIVDLDNITLDSPVEDEETASTSSEDSESVSDPIEDEAETEDPEAAGERVGEFSEIIVTTNIDDNESAIEDADTQSS